ncbi:hypothetical protein BT93_F2124 [Corymbia citriodora subsp. variegata]|nr:hypothetical protein BT93_F2124 [Corymbia citriodora subsp. variegata]
MILNRMKWRWVPRTLRWRTPSNPSSLLPNRRLRAKQVLHPKRSHLLKDRRMASDGLDDVGKHLLSPLFLHISMKFGFWNTRGMMDPVRQSEVRHFVRSHDICCLGLMETKVPPHHFDSISSSLLPGWFWLANYDFSARGRIWIG